MIRPTKFAALLFACAVPLALLIVSAFPSGWIFAIDYALLVLLAIAGDGLLACRPKSLIFRAEIPDYLLVGADGAITVTAEARGHGRRVMLEVLPDIIGYADPALILSMMLEPGLRGDARLRVTPRRRGRLTIERIWLRWHGPLRLTQFVRRVPMDRAIDVLPNIHGLHGDGLKFFAKEALFGIRVQRDRGEGTEFDSLRDYVPGLDKRFIDWKHSARHQELVCKEFRVERNHPIILAFDTGHLMLEPIDGLSRLDHSISAGLALAWTALRGGDLVGLYGFDAAVRQYVAPMRGVSSLNPLRRATSALAYNHEETNFTLGLAELGARLKRRALVILFTDFADTVTAELLVESLRHVARRHAVIFASLSDPWLIEAKDQRPDRFDQAGEAVIAANFLRERRTVFERLDRLGVHCLDVPRESFSLSLINRYLSVKQRGLI